MNSSNLLLFADAYKYSHHRLYAPGTEKIYSYLESRGGAFEQTVFFGLQYLLKEYLSGVVVTKEKIDEAEATMKEVFGRDDVFDRSRFDYILKRHNGRLPVRIKAVREGTVTGTHQALMTIENTDPNCYWLTNFLETLLMQVWYPVTVASQSYEIRKIVKHYYDETAATEAADDIDFVLNDFGFRGASSVESASIGGAAHLLSFRGSDTVIANQWLRKYYNAPVAVGHSVPATEHSVCTLLGEEGELEVFRHVLESYPEGIVSCVSDSFNIFRACREYWGTELKELILSRKGTLVIRPDSGDPVFTLLRVFDILFEKFGYTINDKGYKVLPPQVRVLQGDGLNLSTIRLIYGAMTVNGISAENLVLGMGGALLQKVDRDTLKFALKCSYAEINGRGVDVQKNPVELDHHGQLVHSFKASKSGRLKLIQNGNEYLTVREEEAPETDDQLQLVFENEELFNETSWEEVQEQMKDLREAERETAVVSIK